MIFLHAFCITPNHREKLWFIYDSVMASEESIVFAADLSLILSMILTFVFSNQSTHAVQLLIAKVVYRGSCALVHIQADD